jgi:hypothetical protein
MVTRRLLDRPLLVGCVLGLVFGIVDLVFTWVEPLSDDSIPALLRFYGPMFLSWAFVSFRAVRRSGRLSTGVATGFVVAFGTFCVFYVVNLLRVNLFLAELIGREDWQSMTQRFRVSEVDSLRVFVNVEYLKARLSKSAWRRSSGRSWDSWAEPSHSYQRNPSRFQH